jgi:hypothetical protein
MNYCVLMTRLDFIAVTFTVMLTVGIAVVASLMN